MLVPAAVKNRFYYLSQVNCLRQNTLRQWGGDFFVESPINFVTAIIWFLRKYEDGKYCTQPHLIGNLPKLNFFQY